MANVPEQANHESQGNQRLKEEGCRHEYAEPANGILTEKSSQGVVVWPKNVQQQVEREHNRDAQDDG